ncbi:MFS transporter, partial [Streptomyces sp. W16]|nr:MFS transporter [Streptomyces sp. W16]
GFPAMGLVLAAGLLVVAVPMTAVAVHPGWRRRLQPVELIIEAPASRPVRGAGLYRHAAPPRGATSRHRPAATTPPAYENSYASTSAR